MSNNRCIITVSSSVTTTCANDDSAEGQQGVKILKLTFVLAVVSGISVWVYVLLSRLSDDALSAITMSTVGFLVVGVIVMFFLMYMNAERSMSHRERMYRLETGKGEKAQDKVQVFILGTNGQHNRSNEGFNRRLTGDGNAIASIAETGD